MTPGIPPILGGNRSPQTPSGHNDRMDHDGASPTWIVRLAPAGPEVPGARLAVKDCIDVEAYPVNEYLLPDLARLSPYNQRNCPRPRRGRGHRPLNGPAASISLGSTAIRGLREPVLSSCCGSGLVVGEEIRSVR